MVTFQLHTDTSTAVPRATEDQIKSASSLVKRVDLKNFSVCQFANPGKFVFSEWQSHASCTCLVKCDIQQ